MSDWDKDITYIVERCQGESTVGGVTIASSRTLRYFNSYFLLVHNLGMPHNRTGNGVTVRVYAFVTGPECRMAYLGELPEDGATGNIGFRSSQFRDSLYK